MHKLQVIKDKRILVAALDWGIGHASRLVPIIRRLNEQGYEVILASAGNAKDFFRVYFPNMMVIEKPGYHVSYPKDKSMALAILYQLPSIIRAIIREHMWLKKTIRDLKISEVISDNCYGLWNKKIHSVFITHQIWVKCPQRWKVFEFLISLMIKFF